MYRCHPLKMIYILIAVSKYYIVALSIAWIPFVKVFFLILANLVPRVLLNPSSPCIVYINLFY